MTALELHDLAAAHTDEHHAVTYRFGADGYRFRLESHVGRRAVEFVLPAERVGFMVREEMDRLFRRALRRADAA